jgi:hypothetical protein
MPYSSRLALPRLHFTAPALLLLLAACASEPLEPSERVLIGNWGSPDVELIAIRAGAEIRVGCATIVIERPIALTEDNHFAAQGRLDGSGAEFGEQPVESVTGTLTASQILLAAPSAAGGEPVTYLLEAGMARSASELPECPL